MTLLRSIVVFLALLAQTWPAQTMRFEETAGKCEMGCCAWLVETGMDACGCAESSRPVSPADVPPAGARQQLLAQVVWVDSHDVMPVVPPRRSLSESDARLLERDGFRQSHVRLPVLFCSLLN